MAKIIIGIVGKNGSGKDTVARILAQKLNAQLIVYSGIIEKALLVFLDQVQIGRDDLSCLATYLRGKYGDGIIAKGVKKELDAKPDGVYLLVGARDLGDYELVRSFPNNLFLGVDADVKIRWQRVKARKEKSDDDVSFPEFLEKEELKSEVKIGMLMEHADFIIDNGDTLKDLKISIAEILRLSQL